MTENTFQHKLEELRRQFSTLQQFSREDPRQVREALPPVLAGLQRSLTELHTLASETPESSPSDPRASAENGRHAKPSKRTRPGRGRRFRAIAERGPVLVRILRNEAHCRWANRAWLDFTGRGMEPLLGEGWLQHVHPEDRARCAEICREAFEASRLYRMEYRLRRRTGEYGWVLEIGTPRLTSRGNVGGYLGTAIEITEHKQAETHLALQYSVARVLSEAKTLEDAAGPLLQVLCENLGWDVGELWSVDADERLPQCTRVWASHSIDVSGLEKLSKRRVFSSVPAPPWQSGKPAWIADIAADETLARGPEARFVGLHGMFRVAVSMHGEVRALLRFFSLGVRPENDAVAEFMTSVGAQIGQVLERQDSVERIKESEARKAAILEASLDAVITIDEQGQVLEFNSAAESIFGYRREYAFGRRLADLIVPPRLREQTLSGFRRFQATGESELSGKRFDTFAMKANGAEFPVEVAVASIGNEDQPMLTIFVCDATARFEAEQEVKIYQARLRTIMADLLLAEEHERRRLATDLHDGLSQTIALARMRLSALRLSMDQKLSGALDEIEALIENANRAARTISFELSPPVLHDLGLQPAVRWLVENIQTRYGIEIVLEDDGQPKPADEKTRVILFRSIRELLINAAKHAGARRVHVRLQREQDLVEAAIEDDGIGMEPDVAGVHGSGLLSIRERLNHVGGSMHIDSAPGKGTRIRLCAPLTNRQPKKEKVEA